MKIHTNINKPISASNICESAKFSRLIEIGVKEVDGDVTYVTGCRNIAVQSF